MIDRFPDAALVAVSTACAANGVQRTKRCEETRKTVIEFRGIHDLPGRSKIKSWSVLLLRLHRARCVLPSLAERPPSIAWVRANRSAQEQMCCARGRRLQRAVR